MKRAIIFLGVLATFFVFTSPYLFLKPVATRILSRVFRAPVEIEGVRWTGFGAIRADFVRIGLGRAPEKILEGLHIHQLQTSIFGRVVRIQIERVRLGGEDLGRARGGLLWRADRLAKAHGRVILSEAGVSHVPDPLQKRLLATSAGSALIASYAAGRILLRGKGGPILEAAWQPG